MSLLKQIVKASIASLWPSRAAFTPTASISCALSCEREQPLGCSPASVLPCPQGQLHREL